MKEFSELKSRANMNIVGVALEMIGKFWGVLLDKENGRILLEQEPYLRVKRDPRNGFLGVQRKHSLFQKCRKNENC